MLEPYFFCVERKHVSTEKGSCSKLGRGMLCKGLFLLGLLNPYLTCSRLLHLLVSLSWWEVTRFGVSLGTWSECVSSWLDELV